MSILTLLFASITLITALLTVSVSNPIISVVYLIATFVTTSCYLILNGISFIGISYIIVYVGAILVIFLFVILLFDLRQLITLQANVKFNNLILSLTIVSLFVLVFNIVLSNELYVTFNSWYLNTDLSIYNHSSLVLDSLMSNILQVQSIGYVLYTSHALQLIVISIILLLAMLAVIFLK